MMNEMKKKFAIGVAVTLLALPLSTTLTLADTATSSPTTTSTPVVDTSVPVTVNPATTTSDTTTATTSSTPTPTTTTSAITAPVVDSSGSTVTPANWFTDLIGKLQLMLTFDPVRKAELSEQHALANLAEAQKLMKENKADEAQVALNKYTDKITSAQEFLTQVTDPNSEAAKNLVVALSKVNTNNIQVLSSLLDKLPPQAAQKLALNVVRSMEKAVTKMEKEDAKVPPTTTPTNTTPTPSTTTPVITPDSTTVTPVAPVTPVTAVTDTKTLEKQAKRALEEFKKSLKAEKISVEDQGDQNEEQESQQSQTPTPQAQSTPQSQPTPVTVAPANAPTAPTVTRSTEQNKEGMLKHAEDRNDKGREKEGNHRDR